MGFRYLAQSSTVSLEGVDDGEELRNTLDAMQIIGLSEGECESVLLVSLMFGELSLGECCGLEGGRTAVVQMRRLLN